MLSRKHFFQKGLFLILFFITASCKGPAQSDDSDNGWRSSYHEVSVPMLDGVLLSTDVYTPKKNKKVPVVLVRTPYDKSVEKWMGKAFNMFGIAVVIQDVRGKFKSEGEFYPFVNEREDGLQTIKWLRQQPWFDGTVAGWGGSYVGYTQWAISDELDFLTLLLTGANLYDFTYPDSLFSLQTAFIWGFQNASQNLNKIPADKLASSAMILPLSAADDSTIKEIPFITDWISHSTYDEYWEEMNFRGNTQAQILSMAGWYDIFLKAQIEDFQALEKTGNKSNRLIIGPWAHGSLGEANDYGGLKKTGNPRKIFMYVKDYLKGNRDKLTSPLKNSKYNLFIMERNEYVGSDVWPPAETKITPFYIGPGNYLKAESFSEDGHLEYVYDPANPFPSHGGTALGDGVGPTRQNDNLGRVDQLSFEMNVDTQALTLLGPVSATLWLTSDAPCTDFMVGLQDVFPDGKIINIQEGGAKVHPDKTNPEKTEISVWATGYQLNPGHKLRVIITSSWFPRFNRSLNNCDPIFSAQTISTSVQKIYYGPSTPSSVNLPLYEEQ